MPIVQPNARITGTYTPPQRGGIVNPNGTNRKNAVPVRGTVLGAGLAGLQHSSTHVAIGKTYQSPFTESSANLFSAANNNSTQAVLPALQVESPGKVVATKDFVKVHPTAKGTFFTPTAPASRPVAFRAGGPSKTANTPSNPNRVTPVARPVRAPQTETSSIPPMLSFLRSGGTLTGHPNNDSFQSRWSVTKKGVVA